MLRALSMLVLIGLIPLAAPRALAESTIPAEVVRRTIAALVARWGTAQAERIRRGVEQVAGRWWSEDGEPAAFTAFCEAGFVAGDAELEQVFRRLERVMEQVDGHLHEVRRELHSPLDLDTGPITPLDKLLAEVDLGPHLDDDLFRSRVPFYALLNFPVHTLGERLALGPHWDRESWARSRMMDRFAVRVPAPVQQEATRAFTAADQYIAAYNIRMDRLVTADGRRLFPEGLRLITHWGLRDELAAQYAEPAQGLERQRLIYEVMKRIVRQEIPAAVIDNPNLLWDPAGNRVWPVAGSKAAAPGARPPSEGGPHEREADLRYAHLLQIFRAQRLVDPYTATAPTYMARKFDLERQIPEGEVEALLLSVLESAEVKGLARLVQRRLGRPLEPFDVWYSGFKARGRYAEADLDARVRALYPSVAAYQAAVPRLLARLGFAPGRAQWVAEHIVVDAARGAGHAMGAVRREDSAHLRTRVASGGASGMDYKGYNIALHEMGHNVEQVFSLNGIDFWWLSGVPNNAFTEALAFLFQSRDLELLGLASAGEEAQRAAALGRLWNTYEIAGVALVDMRLWHWMYDHPDATPAALREATLAIAREVWNRHYAPLFGGSRDLPGDPSGECRSSTADEPVAADAARKCSTAAAGPQQAAAAADAEILAVYSHMIEYGLYLPDYALGHIIAAQVAAKVRQGDFGAEFERLARQGRLTPDAWMRGAVGGPLSAQPLLSEARRALSAEGAPSAAH
ncbi:MAG TPA: hypothetical protein VHR45_22380 [Thermoanaerobaculia bacterium]|nr:hypothetical protein [Thermoanaerobaculia bacterium]